MFNNCYKGKRVFLTGHTGFKGGWISLWLHHLGAEICGYSLAPNTTLSFYSALKLENMCQSIIGNILGRDSLEKAMQEFKPDIVFHLAAQPLVRLSYAEPVLTYETNVMGTLNILEAARRTSSVQAVVNITTDKCYENKEITRGYIESDPMGGYDMYSSSKGCAELLSSSYRRSFLENGYALATARAGNVIGGGDWSLDRLIPDCVRAIHDNMDIQIRNPLSVRPWQHVLEPLSGYLLLGERLLTEGKKYAEAFNFGPSEENVLTVEEVVHKLIQSYGKGKMVVTPDKDKLHEANLLMLNIDKARETLGWHPVLNIDKTIKKTASWYKNFYESDDMVEFTLKQIQEYEEKYERAH